MREKQPRCGVESQQISQLASNRCFIAKPKKKYVYQILRHDIPFPQVAIPHVSKHRAQTRLSREHRYLKYREVGFRRSGIATMQCYLLSITLYLFFCFVSLFSSTDFHELQFLRLNFFSIFQRSIETTPHDKHDALLLVHFRLLCVNDYCSCSCPSSICQ